MEYIGDGDWKCTTCGSVIAFGKPDEGDDNNGEALSLWDAADIYLSRGFDEDYRFGYTHEELMKALAK
ncbi:hypothetical protein DIC82_16550 [Clostridium beijerinckii]|nr:hypothetical protein DIC82_16550 [Clostridium beijerinckii]